MTEQNEHKDLQPDNESEETQGMENTSAEEQSGEIKSEENQEAETSATEEQQKNAESTDTQYVADNSSDEQKQEEKAVDAEDSKTEEPVEASPEIAAGNSEETESEKTTAEEKDHIKHGESLHDEHEHEHHEEADEDLHEEEANEADEEEEFDFSHAGKQELVTFLDKVLKEDRVFKNANWVNEAKNRYEELFEAERKKALEDFLSIEGNNEIDFQFPIQMVDRQWRELYRDYVRRKKARREEANKRRQDNLKAKKALLEELKALGNEAMDSNSFNKLRDIQNRWRQIGSVPVADAENLYKTYRFLNDKFFEQRAHVKELLEYDRKKNLDIKLDLIKQMNEVVDNATILREMLRQLKQLQESWRDTGHIPKENMDEVMEAYRTVNDRITEKKDQLLAVREEKRKANLEAKEEIIDQILSLTDDEHNLTWIKRNQHLSKLIEAWKLVGPVTKDDTERIRTEFRDAVKVFNKLKNTFFKEQKKEKMTNLSLKVSACEKVEEILENSTDPAQDREEVIKIQRYWKTIGPVPRKQSDEVWNRFRTVCDKFFQGLKEKNKEALQDQKENLKKKEKLVEELEALSKAEEINEEALDKIEDAWREIGFVPIKSKKTIEKRYQQAMQAVVAKTVDLDDVPEEISGFKDRLTKLLSSPNPERDLSKEENKLKSSVSKLKEELRTLETNIQFFSAAKGSTVLDDTKKKIEKTRKELESHVLELKEVRKAFNQLRR